MGDNGPYSLGGFKGKGKRHKGDHRGSGKGSKATVIIAWVLLAVPVSAIAAAVGYVVHGHLAG